LFVVLPLLLADVFADLFGEGIAVLDGISIITQQVVAFALPATVVLGIVGPRIWEGKIARLIDDLETAVTLRQVEEATRSALEDRSVELLAWLPELGAWRDASGVLRDAPPGQMQTDVVLSGDLLGVICHDETSDLPLMSSVASTVALALRRIQLQAEVEARLEEVQRSRRRIVEAADEARRAIERDLHDGAQQRLVVLAMGLDLERGRFDDPEVHRVLEDAAEHARKALEEIRSLSRGMYPPALSSDGLQLAIEGLADASPVPTQIDVVEGRFDRRAETTAYFVVAESLANAAKHAQAKQIRVDVSSTGDALVVEVHDDGTGGATTRDAGGIEGLHDRVSAIGGKLEVLSPDLGGTTVRAVIPLEQADQRSG
jgi:signal transduction histidine kinase